MQQTFYVFFDGRGRQLASSLKSSEHDAEELAKELANDCSDVVEYFSASGLEGLALPEVLV